MTSGQRTGASLVWFRQDLRLKDNPALCAAAANDAPVIPVYIWSPGEEGRWEPGAASKWWLHHSLRALGESLQRRGSRLILARGPALQTLATLAARTGAASVFWNRRYEPAAAACSRRVEAGLRRAGLRVDTFNSALLAEPGDLLNQSGKPYQVFSAFQRNLLHLTDPATPLPLPRNLRSPQRWPQSASLNSLQLLPKVRWDQTLEANWAPGETGAQAHLQRFRDCDLADYREARDLPARAGTSQLSPHLHFGEIGPRQIWHALGPTGRGSVFLKELLWREFAHHLLHHFPHTVAEPLRPEFRQFPWRRNSRLTTAWQKGATGIPLVDAGMRELWANGWMHNRVRMVTASFLVKNLLVPWQEGARWFWDTLVDADLANNTLNWQWVAGCGADAAPYFRIFNPLTQARRFDPQGQYIHRWVPELAHGAPAPHAQRGLFDSYPPPIVDLQASRQAALDAYQQMRRV